MRGPEDTDSEGGETDAHVRRYYDQHAFRVWPDGTVQSFDDAPHSHKSDDFAVMWAYSEEEALAGARALGLT